MSKVGFVGLGIMGAPMAGHLQAGGHQLFALTHGKVPDALVAGGATVCANGKEVAQTADIIVTMVPDTPVKAKSARPPPVRTGQLRPHVPHDRARFARDPR